MRWHDVLFAHWPVRCEDLAAHVPPGLELDTFDGSAWLGVVPFTMSAVRPRGFPALPWVSAFPELNVRTYVRAGGKAGVWFFSLDAASRLAVRAARWRFHLPYYDARMEARVNEDGRTAYRSARTHRGAPAAAFAATYGPTDPPARAERGTVEHWLTERYCLYSSGRRGRLFRGEILHRPWPLAAAAAEVETNTMAAPLGVALEGSPLLHFAARLEVLAWGLEPV